MVVKCLSISEVSTDQYGLVFNHEFVKEDKSKENDEIVAGVIKLVRKQRMEDIVVGKHYRLEFIPYSIIKKEKEKEREDGERGKKESGKKGGTDKTVDS